MTPSASYDAAEERGKLSSPPLRVHWYPPGWRGAVAGLLTASAASLPAILLLVLLASDPPVTPPVLLQLFALGALLPAAGAAAIRASCVGEIRVAGSEIQVRQRRRQTEVPLAAITGVEPWALPLPASGVCLRLRSGRRLGIALADPSPLLRDFAAAAIDGAIAALDHPSLVHARARAARRRRFWDQPFVKFLLFALFPAGVLFNTHQHIAYGGLLGEYHLLGLRSFLTTAATYWVTLTIYLVLYASVWRAPAELSCWLTARVAPPRAAGVRRAVEMACTLLYYGGVPVLLALRYFG
jgi:hypothetical protein